MGRIMRWEKLGGGGRLVERVWKRWEVGGRSLEEVGGVWKKSGGGGR